MAKRKNGDFGEQHEAIMERGETPASKSALDAVIAAKQIRGGKFSSKDLLDALRYGRFAELSNLEKAWVQKNLRRDVKVHLPKDFQVDERVLDQEAPEDEAEAAEKPDALESAGEDSVQAEQEALEELVSLAFRELRLQFERASADGVAFSIDKALEPYKEALGDEGARQTLNRLTGEGITDLREGGEEQAPAEVHGRPPEEARAQRGKEEFLRFELNKRGQLEEVFRYEGEDREMSKPTRFMRLPDWFSRIKNDPRKVEQCLGGLSRIYRALKPRDVKLLLTRQHGRRGGPVIGFKLLFTATKDKYDLPSDPEILQAVNRAEEAGLNYWDAEGFKGWRDAQKTNLRSQYRAQRMAQLAEQLGVAEETPTAAPAVEPAVPPVPVEPTPASEPPPKPVASAPAPEPEPTPAPAPPPRTPTIVGVPTPPEPVAPAPEPPPAAPEPRPVAPRIVWPPTERPGQFEVKGEIGAPREPARPPESPPPPAERRPGIVGPPPERRPGQSEDEYLEGWRLWADAAKSGVKAVPKFVWGVASTLLGVKAAETTLRFFAERGRIKRAKKEVGELISGLRDLLRREPQRAEGGEQTAVSAPVAEKTRALEGKLAELEREAKITAADREKMLTRLQAAVSRRQEEGQAAQEALQKEAAQIIEDYFQRKASGLELGKQWLNTGLLLSGWQTARAVTYGGLTVVQRFTRARAEHKRRAGEGAGEGASEAQFSVWRDVIKQSVSDYLKGASGVFVNLATGVRVSRSEWAQKKMEFSKALATTMIAAGMAKVVHAEFSESGLTGEIDTILSKMEKQGIAATLANNWLHNLEQLSFGLLRFEKGGELTVADQPDEGVAKAPAASAVPEAPEIVKPPEQIAYENALERLENASDGKVDFDPDSGRLEITLGKGGYAQIQHALRDLSVLEKMAADKTFTTVEATQVENVVANLKYLLEGKDLRFMDAERLDGIAHLGAGKLIIDDVAKFHEVMQKELLAHASGKITAATLGRYDEAVATVNNTSDANWQRDVNVGTGVEDARAEDYVKAEIDHTLVHRAEIDAAGHAVDELGIAGLKVAPEDVDDENNFTAHLEDRLVVVENGLVRQIQTSWTAPSGTEYTLPYNLPEPVDIHHPYAGDELRQSFTKAYTQAIKEGSIRAEIVATGAEAGAGPSDFEEILRSEAEGGLVASDGYIHFGEVRFKPEWLGRVDEVSIEQFADKPTETLSLLNQFSEQARALRSLAAAIRKHPDSGTVGDYVVKHADQLENWMRETAQIGEEIGGV